MRLVWKGEGCEVWSGDALDEAGMESVMQGRRAGLLSVDAPYSARTHDGFDGGKASQAGQLYKGAPVTKRTNNTIDYSAWSPADVRRAVTLWHQHCAGWFLSTTDHTLEPTWSEALESAGRYVFAPLPWVEVGSRIRLSGDGPSSWTCWLVCSRPRSAPYAKWGTLKGAYIGPGENKQNRPQRIMGAKSLALTCELIEDYSRPNDLVLDPCAGGGTTLTAARMTGRRCIGIEKDEGRAELIARILRDGKHVADPNQPKLFE